MLVQVEQTVNKSTMRGQPAGIPAYRSHIPPFVCLTGLVRERVSDHVTEHQRQFS
jgi:hypothetical protein